MKIDVKAWETRISNNSHMYSKMSKEYTEIAKSIGDVTLDIIPDGTKYYFLREYIPETSEKHKRVACFKVGFYGDGSLYYDIAIYDKLAFTKEVILICKSFVGYVLEFVAVMRAHNLIYGADEEDWSL